jgi:2-haloacid dehalogenase
VLSVDVVRMYKPRPDVYALVTDHFGVTPDEVVFVSSNRWDVMGAASFGFRTVWVNRAQMPQEYPHQPPVHTVSNLSALTSLAF